MDRWIDWWMVDCCQLEYCRLSYMEINWNCIRNKRKQYNNNIRHGPVTGSKEMQQMISFFLFYLLLFFVSRFPFLAISRLLLLLFVYITMWAKHIIVWNVALCNIHAINQMKRSKCGCQTIDSQWVRMVIMHLSFLLTEMQQFIVFKNKMWKVQKWYLQLFFYFMSIQSECVSSVSSRLWVSLSIDLMRFDLNAFCMFEIYSIVQCTMYIVHMPSNYLNDTWFVVVWLTRSLCV